MKLKTSMLEECEFFYDWIVRNGYDLKKVRY